MKMRTLIIAALVIGLFMTLGCTQQKTPVQPTDPAIKGAPVKPGEKPDEGPGIKVLPSKFDKETEALFEALDKFKHEDDFRFEKEFVALKAKAQEHAKKKDKVFIESLFILAQNGPPVRKKAANELLLYVISDYKGEDWADHAMYREKAIEVVTTSDDPEYRKGCWGFLTYYYEPEIITPKVLETFGKTKDKKLRLEILQNIGSPASGAFIEKNEEALNKIGLAIVKDDKETTEMKVAAIAILKSSGMKDPNVAKELSALKDSSDEKIKKAAIEALKDAPKDASKAAPKEAVKEVPKEAVKETDNKVEKEAIKEVPKEAVKEVPKEAVKEEVKEVPKEAVEKTEK
ncbi:MAG: hypothetical protein K8T10_17370 [Candidatus Eremiobacteraeota bacterium]|nr:hypothetical protein [Candidatus Eremiobacteraeota bacterium]